MESYSSLCLLSYKPIDYLRKGTFQNGYALMDDGGEHVKTFVNDEKREVVVVYRGTNSLSDFIYDIQSVVSMDWMRTKEMIDYAKSMRRVTPEGYTFLLAGHSIGGHTAMWAAIEMPDIDCIAFSPFVHNSFITHFRYTDRMTIYVNRKDPVPHGNLIGDYELGAHHSRRARWIIRNKHESIHDGFSGFISHSLLQWGAVTISDPPHRRPPMIPPGDDWMPPFGGDVNGDSWMPGFGGGDTAAGDSSWMPPFTGDDATAGDSSWMPPFTGDDTTGQEANDWMPHFV